MKSNNNNENKSIKSEDGSLLKHEKKELKKFFGEGATELFDNDSFLPSYEYFDNLLKEDDILEKDYMAEQLSKNQSKENIKTAEEKPAEEKEPIYQEATDSKEAVEEKKDLKKVTAEKAPKKKEHIKKNIPSIDFDAVAVLKEMKSFTEGLGLGLGTFFVKLWQKPKNFFVSAGLIFAELFRRMWKAFSGWVNKISKSFVSQYRAFLHDIKLISYYLAKGKGQRMSVFAAIFHYARKGLKRHSDFLRTIGNYLLPVLAVIAFVVTVNYWSSVTFALKVNYNDKEIGYIADETVYNEAKAAAQDRIDTGKGANHAKVEDPTYELSLVSLNELVDSTVLTDRIIENSSSNVTNACGIYIDDEFVCAVKNETDATSVFHTILEPYEKKLNDDSSFVDFVEKVEYVQGLYSDDKDTMWDAGKLKEQLSQTKQAAKTYTIKDGDTIYDIALANDISVDELLSLNPGKDESLFPGEKIIISNEVNYVRVKLMKTEQRKVEIDYETEKVNNASMFKGTKRTVREGKPGEEVVTELVTYIDGQRVTAQEISRETTKEPVKAKVQIGTKPTTVSGGSYNVSVSQNGFIWPAPACTFVSSYFGWRTLRGYSDFHTGLDLTKPGGGSTGAVVVASLDGTVETVQRSNRGYGHCVVINHGGGLKTRYAHCLPGSLSVSVGQHVRAGQAIARVGSSGNVTGPHLHFEIIINGQCVNPLPYLR